MSYCITVQVKIGLTRTASLSATIRPLLLHFCRKTRLCTCKTLYASWVKVPILCQVGNNGLQHSPRCAAVPQQEGWSSCLHHKREAEA